ncbi:hypothetical protein D0817_01545 [Flavobacterium cupreum]|uniref:Cytochrome B n=1 Tax=Flavobacterium cupreum TaxID=2133766 RepID=A0A434AD60_9FLAO|nr:hypothetical protein [Flavobacterium cupreum]RUT72322.1 hypothetical protein D0817_01545 [Flavobacterium cupreum]
MYLTLLFVHSAVRWLVLLSLFYAVIRSYRGYHSQSSFTKTDHLVRHWTATIAHIQLMLGIVLYSQSALIKYFWNHFAEASKDLNTLFFGLIHLVLMLLAIVVITIGSAAAKRKTADSDKFKTMLIWFSIALIIIFIAIPWPFSPLANRPYFRSL